MWRRLVRFVKGLMISGRVPKRACVLCIGLEGSGKTELLQKLQRRQCTKHLADDVQVGQTLPTIGVAHFDLPARRPQKRRHSILIKEVGGAMSGIWSKFYRSSLSAVLFVLDASDIAHAASSFVEMQSILQSPSMQGVPMAMIINKMDLPFCLSLSELDALAKATFGYSPWTDGRKRVTPFLMSVHRDQNLTALLQWIINATNQNEASS